VKIFIIKGSAVDQAESKKTFPDCSGSLVQDPATGWTQSLGRDFQQKNSYIKWLSSKTMLFYLWYYY